MYKKEYHKGEKRCRSCYWWEWKNLHTLEEGRCTNPFQCGRREINEK
ncbi:MAG: hypothetical protein J6S67_05430 [Methanobrevibacter sp.]|nr:hypothetical protein [Methanobrevibacter sp.]